MSRPWLSLWLITTSIVLFIFIGCEVSLRISGFGSYPLYDIDDEIMYIPKSSQSGSFLNRNAWVFNNKHMGNTDNWTPHTHPNVLLVGNSIVLGGLPYDQKDKLGPLLEKSLGQSYVVWSAAAGKWSNVNEIVYLERNADVLQNSDVVILEYMERGLASPTPWPGYYMFPDHKPLMLTSYILGKYALPRLLGSQVEGSGGDAPPDHVDPTNLQRFNAVVSAIAKTKKLVIFLYPTRQNLHDKEGWARIITPILKTCQALSLSCLDLAKENLWTEDLYRDDGLHPTVEGNKALAAILASAVK